MPLESMVPDGPLRDRLVRAGAALLAEEGASGVTLRAIARRAGVSHGAPRRYFPTRSALLSAVAARGFQALHRAMTGAPDLTDAVGEGTFVRTYRTKGPLTHENAPPTPTPTPSPPSPTPSPSCGARRWPTSSSRSATGACSS